MTTPKDLAERLRAYEADHAPDGWPAVQTRELSAAADLIERQAAEIAELRAANERFAVRQTWWTMRMFELEQERDALKRRLDDCDGG